MSDKIRHSGRESKGKLRENRGACAEQRKLHFRFFNMPLAYIFVSIFFAQHTLMLNLWSSIALWVFGLGLVSDFRPGAFTQPDSGRCEKTFHLLPDR